MNLAWLHTGTGCPACRSTSGLEWLAQVDHNAAVERVSSPPTSAGLSDTRLRPNHDLRQRQIPHYTTTGSIVAIATPSRRHGGAGMLPRPCPKQAVSSASAALALANTSPSTACPPQCATATVHTDPAYPDVSALEVGLACTWIHHQPLPALQVRSRTTTDRDLA